MTLLILLLMNNKQTTENYSGEDCNYCIGTGTSAMKEFAEKKYEEVENHLIENNFIGRFPLQLGVPETSTNKTTLEERFWEMFDGMKFTISAYSITDEIIEYPEAITDMEAIIDIRGQFNKYGINEWIKQEIALAVQQERDRIRIISEEAKYDIDEEDDFIPEDLEAYMKGYNVSIQDIIKAINQDHE